MHQCCCKQRARAAASLCNNRALQSFMHVSALQGNGQSRFITMRRIALWALTENIDAPEGSGFGV